MANLALPSKPARPAPRWRRPAALLRARRTLREQGPRGLLVGVLAEFGYRRLVVMALSLDTAIAERRPGVPVTIAWLDPSHADDYVRFRPDTDPAEVAQALAGGARCLAVRHEGRIVHAGWATVRNPWIDYLGCEMPLGPGDVYQFGSYTVPTHRGYGIAAARVAFMARYFQALGHGRLLAGVQPELREAFRPLERVGYRALGRLSVVRIGPWQRLRWRPIAPRP